MITPGTTETRLSRRESLKIEQVRKLTRERSLEEVEIEQKHARRIFEKYDTDKSGYIEASEVIPILKDTYKILEREFDPSPNDVAKYIEMMDTDHNGKISLLEYEVFLLQALDLRNIKL